MTSVPENYWPAWREPEDLDPQTRTEIHQAVWGITDKEFDRKLDELARVYEFPTPEHRSYLDRWYGDEAISVPGVHLCNVCHRPLDDPRVCMDCGIFNPLDPWEWPRLEW